ncbi:MAG TPA: hypothetical protein P5509_08495 [Bacteroidales bacterium]|nr:hypothetical protein [Bacteroidales bacterium]
MNDFESLDFFGDDGNKGQKKNKNKEELEKILKLEEEAKKSFDPENLEEIINYLEKYKFKPDNDIHNFNINGFNTLKNQIKIWHKSALDFNVKYTGKINEKQVLDLINNELNACYKENHRNFLSKIKNKKQLNERIEAINSLIKEYKLSEQEKNIFYRNIIMQKAFFINAFFFAENSDKFRKIINLIKS